MCLKDLSSSFLVRSSLILLLNCIHMLFIVCLENVASLYLLCCSQFISRDCTHTYIFIYFQLSKYFIFSCVKVGIYYYFDSDSIIVTIDVFSPATPFQLLLLLLPIRLLLLLLLYCCSAMLNFLFPSSFTHFCEAL